MNSFNLASSHLQSWAGGRFRTLLPALMLAFTATAQTGEKGSLSAEFEKMSPKERARVAREEQAASSSDPAYLAAMAQGETNFRNGDLDAAMVNYEDARRLRPLNVYPKVKIEDLRVLIRKREEELLAAKDSAPDPPRTPEPVVVIADERPIGKTEAATIKVVPVEQPASQMAKRVDPVAKPKTTEIREAGPANTPVQKLPDGSTENRYKQGNAEVTQITVTNNGRTTVYKRVAHKWGQVYWFQDGQAIDGRVWVERFGDKR